MRYFLYSVICLLSASIFAAPSVEVETTLGNFTIELDSNNAPVTTENFLRYVEDGSYVGTIFHRVIPNFMAQGGGFDKNMQRVKTYAPIKNEAENGLKNDTATISMARTSDPDSATRQFFINYQNNSFLNKSAENPGYAVFGKVTKGFDIIESMATKKTASLSSPPAVFHDVPVETVIITKVTLLK